uniref:Uncharacterized protein n=1 Tax=Pristionchus pacificus TaxID=54126 RepID=A0A2A6BUN3_PRIPA|eukprot:PDM69609.1 hypothetical protein PRIPAC_44705 [Pristionchus pacificus]
MERRVYKYSYTAGPSDRKSEVNGVNVETATLQGAFACILTTSGTVRYAPAAGLYTYSILDGHLNIQNILRVKRCAQKPGGASGIDATTGK